MNSFVDTNVSIAYTFSIDPLNNNSRKVFKDYENILWSNNVKKEFHKVFLAKSDSLVTFYEGLVVDIEHGNFHDFTLDNLEKHVKRNYSKDKDYNQILSSLKPFWEEYVGEYLPNYLSFKSAIEECKRDLRIKIYSKKEKWESKILLTVERVEKYEGLKSKLDSLGVHFPDDEIVLDAHDYNLRVEDKINFITFDRGFYDAVHQIEDFCFNKVLGKLDF